MKTLLSGFCAIVTLLSEKGNLDFKTALIMIDVKTLWILIVGITVVALMLREIYHFGHKHGRLKPIEYDKEAALFADDDAIDGDD